MKGMGRAATAAFFATALFLAPALPSSESRDVASAQAGWIILSTYSAAPGQTFSAHGYGFQSGETVRFTFRDASVQSTADASGHAVSPALTVPAAKAGSYPVTARGQTSGRMQSADLYVSGYYPVAFPSAYYVLPGQRLGFSGQRFAPGEQIDVKHSDTVVDTFAADGAGSFTAPGVLTVPQSAAGTELRYRLQGRRSGAVFTIDVTVGRFHPQIRLSSYSVRNGMQFSADGEGFAPGESVELYVRGVKVAARTSDGEGRVHFDAVAAPGAGDADVRATGVQSGRGSSRTLHAY